MKRVFILKGLDCPNCSAKIEKEVGALPGVESSVVNLMQQTLTVQSEKSADATLAEQVETIGGYLPAGHRYHDRPQPRARC